MRRWTTTIAFLIAALTVTARAQDDLHKVLSQMDAASARFQSAEAQFEWDVFEAAVQQTDVQKGSIYMERRGHETDMAAVILPPEEKRLVYRGGELKLYEPKIDHLTIVSAGSNRGQYESFLTLGFGGSGADLEKGWTVKYLGRESVDGVDTAKLELVSKDQSVRNVFSRVVLWMDPARALSLKQQFFEPGGDSRTSHYTGLKLNQKIPGSAFEVKTTAKTTVVHK